MVTIVSSNGTSIARPPTKSEPPTLPEVSGHRSEAIIIIIMIIIIIIIIIITTCTITITITIIITITIAIITSN